MISNNKIATVGLLSLALLAGGIVAQQAPPSSETKQQMKAKMQVKMKDGGMMGQMAAHHEEMSQLMGKLMESMAALRSEKDPAKLQTKLAEHAALLDQMKTKMSAQKSMMDSMMATENGKAAK